jgi:hypothetical protein
MAIQTGTITRTTVPADWSKILLAAKQGAVDGINEWLNTARMEGGWIGATVGTFKAPLLKSDLQWISPRINPYVVPAVTAQIPNSTAAPIAQAISLEIAHAWSAWADDFHFPPWVAAGFPAFAAFPMPIAPPSPPTPPIGKLYVTNGVSSGAVRLQRSTFASRLTTALQTAGAMTAPAPATGGIGATAPSTTVSGLVSSKPPLGSMAAVNSTGITLPGTSTTKSNYAGVVGVTPAVAGPQDFANQLAAWMDESFLRWCASAYFDNIMGQGPIPTFAPPYVPVGPVVGGTLTGDLYFQAFGI